MKKKNVAGILGLILGVFGVHRFYLGQKKLGLLYFGSFLIGLSIAILNPWENPALFFAIPAIVGLIDAILFFVMPQMEFDKKYNAAFANWENTRTPISFLEPREKVQPQPKIQTNRYKQMGIESYRTYDYSGAVKYFHRALDFNYRDPAIHFNLACCYSILEQADNSFFHLDKAVNFGFDNYKKIHNHKALAYLRAHETFDSFVDNHYQLTDVMLGTEEEEEEDLLSTPVTMRQDILEKIASLGELRDKGFLTDEEFSMQKRRLLSRNE